MATYIELDELLKLDESTKLRRRVAVATMVEGDKIRLEPEAPTDATAQARKRFAQQLFRQSAKPELYFRPDDSALSLNSLFEAVYRLMLIANKAATVAQITNATDEAIQSAVADAVTYLAKDFPEPGV